MTPPSRTLGIAFSDGERVSRIAGAVVRADGTLDGLEYGACTVGGTDATDALASLVANLGREDVTHLCLAGVAPARYNVVDIGRLHDEVGKPVLAMSTGRSDGLDSAIKEAFEGEARATRLERYRSLTERHAMEVARGTPRFVRAVGIEPERAVMTAQALVRDGFTRPEPVRVAALAASAHRAAMPDRAD